MANSKSFLKGFLAVFVLCSIVLSSVCFVFASSDGSAVVSDQGDSLPDSDFLAPDLDDVSKLSFAQDIKAASATSYTVDDIYSLLNSALKGSSSSTTYSLPYIANRINTINSKVSSLDTNVATVVSRLLDISNALNGPSSVYNVLDALYYQTDSGNMVSASELLAYVWVHSDNIDSSLTSYLPVIQQALSSIDGHVQQVKSSVDSVKTSVDTLHSDFSSVLSSLGSNSWVSRSSTYYGCSDSFDGVYDTSVKTSPDLYFKFSCNPIVGNVVSRFLIPIVNNPITSYCDFDFYVLDTNSEWVFVPTDYYFEACYLYFYNIPVAPLNSTYIIHVSNPYNSIIPLKSNSLTFSYSYLANSVYSTLLRNSYSTLNQEKYLSSLSSLYASPDLVQAKANQQDYEDAVISEFTGSGSSAASLGDVADASDLSNALSSGLDSGGSVSNALVVLDPSGDFWSWFSQLNYYNINELHRSGYDRPSRSSGSDVPEVIDLYNQNLLVLQNLLGGDSK